MNRAQRRNRKVAAAGFEPFLLGEKVNRIVGLVLKLTNTISNRFTIYKEPRVSIVEVSLQFLRLVVLIV